MSAYVRAAPGSHLDEPRPVELWQADLDVAVRHEGDDRIAARPPA
jgi:hypothetical protein